MPTTFHLRVWTRFLAPVEEVWALKTDPRAIVAEFRPHGFSMAETDLAAALAGKVPADIAATFRFGGIPPGISWPIRLESVVEHQRYRDTSTNALYSRWEHDHVFETTPDGCRYVDAVTFTSTAPLQKLFAILTKRTFERRHRIAAKRIATDPQATAVSVLRVLVEAEEEAAHGAG
jgi:ligand-binding SRPBCC domain-containing protein